MLRLCCNKTASAEACRFSACRLAWGVLLHGDNVPGRNSYNSTSWPRWAAYNAASEPTGPAPTITVFCEPDILIYVCLLQHQGSRVKVEEADGVCREGFMFVA